MRYILSMLILITSLSFFTIACGGDTTSSSDACSATNTTGTCPTGKTCNNGVCVDNTTCTPSCTGKTCGDDGCGGSCGSCNAGETCNAAGTCETGTCTPNCAGKVCGDDGCGGSCGSCNVGETCNANGTCETGTCTPNCAGKECGDDGCGGSCGSCNAGENCNANGACETTSADGELGGNCSEQIACIDNTNLCLGPQGGQAICYQACNGASDTSCTQNNYTCQNVDSIGFVCLPDPTGNTPIGGDCSSEACVEAAICLNPDAPTCYEKCNAATDTCTTSGYTCQDTGNADIGWVCAPHSEPGTAQPGETCSAENNCVETAMCLTKQGETTSTCYEKCTAATDTCSQAGYACVDTGVAGIDWICMEQAAPGTVPVGGTCDAQNNCVAEASCLGPEGGPYTCYEKCDPDTGGTCSQANYTCEAVAEANFCMPPQQ